jgi:hypothetical protein
MDAELVGIGVMTPLAWLPAANALLTLFVIKNYRQFLIDLVCGDKLNQVSIWTNSRSNTYNAQANPGVSSSVPL